MQNYTITSVFFSISKSIIWSGWICLVLHPCSSLVNCISMKLLLSCSIKLNALFNRCFVCNAGCISLTSKSTLILGIILLQLPATACSGSPASTRIILLKLPEVICSDSPTCTRIIPLEIAAIVCYGSWVCASL